MAKNWNHLVNGSPTINFIHLHLAKTDCILFGPKPKLKTTSKFQITFNDHVIKSQRSIKYVGLQTDQYFSGAFSGQYQ